MNSQTLDTDIGRTMLYTSNKSKDTDSAILLYLHGGPGSPCPSVVDELCYSGPVYTYDQFGCGESDKKESYDADLFVEQLHQVLGHLPASNPVILMGASWGGMLACLYIRRYGTDRIKALILASPCISNPDSNRHFEEVIDSLPEPIRNEICNAEKTSFFGETYALARRALIKEIYGRHDSEESCDEIFSSPQNDVFHQLNSDEAFDEISVEDVLSTIDVPVLYISGDHDIHGVEDVRRYASLIPDAELHILEDTGHYTSSHPDYDLIIKKFTERVNPGEYASDTSGFSLQKDYDMILSYSPHDTRRNLDIEASGLSKEECVKMAERYEKGDGVPQSFFSAKVFLLAACYRNEQAFSLDSIKEFQRADYDASNPNRKLLLSPRGVESTCCSQLRRVLSGCSWSESDKKITIRRDDQEEPEEIDECPFCGCRLGIMLPEAVKQIASDDEYFTMMDRYKEYYYDRIDAVSMWMSLRSYMLKKHLIDRGIVRRVCEMSSKIEEQERERLRNVTGVLTRSSAGFESACCREFAENYLYASSCRYDSYYADIEMKDGTNIRNFKFCPYCNSRMKRVPRTY